MKSQRLWLLKLHVIFHLEEVEIETPVQNEQSNVIAGKKLGIVPILRAGLGMVEGILN